MLQERVVFEFATGAGVKTNCSSLTICQEEAQDICRFAKAQNIFRTYALGWVGGRVFRRTPRFQAKRLLPDGHRATRYSQSKHSNALNTGS